MGYIKHGCNLVPRAFFLFSICEDGVLTYRKEKKCPGDKVDMDAVFQNPVIKFGLRIVKLLGYEEFIVAVITV